MGILVSLLLAICRFSGRFPWVVIPTFLVAAVWGFSTMPKIKISTNLVAGIGDADSLINLTKENNDIFGEQDALILAVEFPEPPGENRVAFLRELSDEIQKLADVRRVRYRFLDPDDHEGVMALFGAFLRGMNENERSGLRHVVNPETVLDAFRRNRNRLFLVENPYLQKRILEDPIELGKFISDSVRARVGALSLGDTYLLIGAPDGAVFLIQVTPSFPSSELVQGKALIEAIQKVVPGKIAELAAKYPDTARTASEITWHMTGKTVFHHESDLVFENDTARILGFSFGMVTLLLFIVYRSFSAGLILLIPIIAGVGPNYGLVYLLYDEVNPVVMGSTGVLFGLGTDFGVHLWGRLREELDHGASPLEAAERVYIQAGPAVTLGGLTSLLAFLCLCLSKQPAMVQFGYVGASGIALTLISTLFLFPALNTVLSKRTRDYYPRMRVSFGFLTGLYRRNPKAIAAGSFVILAAAFALTLRISYEKDLFKVFMARDMQSMAVSERISRKFHSNFAQPVHLSFDSENLEKGLELQRALDTKLAALIARDGEIASFDSISYLMSPQAAHAENQEFFKTVVSGWDAVKNAFNLGAEKAELSREAEEIARSSFNAVGNLFTKLQTSSTRDTDAWELEKSWYLAKIRGKYRFLTQIRYSEKVMDSDMLRRADDRIAAEIKNIPVKIGISGPRKVMEEILSGLVSELIRLGGVVLVVVVVFFWAAFRRLPEVILSLIPMVGAFVITMGIFGAAGMGLPFSIVGVAPLIFGLGMDNGVHVVTGALQNSVDETMNHVTKPIVFTSLTNVMGFVSMITSKHYSLEFLGWAMVIGMTTAVLLTLTTLPALLLLLERRRSKLDRSFV